MSGAAPKNNDQNKESGRRRYRHNRNQEQGTATNAIQVTPGAIFSSDDFPTLQAATSQHTTMASAAAAFEPPSNMVGTPMRSILPYLPPLIFARRSQ